jgi:hypothetical protein
MQQSNAVQLNALAIRGGHLFRGLDCFVYSRVSKNLQLLEDTWDGKIPNFRDPKEVQGGTNPTTTNTAPAK